MAQKYNVYFGNRLVIFTQEVKGTEIDASVGAVIQSSGKLDTMLIEDAISRGSRIIQVVCKDLEASWKQFLSQFEFVQAAGGLVTNPADEVLFIYRLEKWDLPKGKVEAGEDILAAAVREVEEECSITDLNVERFLGRTWHTYMQHGHPFLKATDWYFMRYNGLAAPAPQKEEGIAETRWLKENDWHIVRSNTYPSVIDVLSFYKSEQRD